MSGNNVIELNLSEYWEKHGSNVGFPIPPNTYVKVSPVTLGDDDEPLVSLHIVNACLGVQAKGGERAVLTISELDTPETNEFVCCTLSPGVCENAPLDLEIHGDCMIGNLNAPNTTIHLVGRLAESSEHDSEYQPEDEEDNEYDEFYNGLHDEYYEDDDDDPDDDDGEDDDESGYLEESYLIGDNDEDDLPRRPSSKTKIEMLPDDEEEQSKNEQIRSKSNGNKRMKPYNEEKPEKKISKIQKDSRKQIDSEKAQTVEGQAKGRTVTPEQVLWFLKEELSKKACLGAELGGTISSKFGCAFKKLGLPQKTLQGFIQVYAPNDIVINKDVYSLKNK